MLQYYTCMQYTLRHKIIHIWSTYEHPYRTYHVVWQRFTKIGQGTSKNPWMENKNSSGDEIANVNFYAVRP